MPHINTPDAEPDLRLQDTRLLLEIPLNINELREQDAAAARLWQDRVRAACLHYFQAGYVVTDFVLVDRAFYVLEKE
jgi:predicted GNAT superfamily acetyltransferase